jgi:hypothetical protein
VVAQLPHGHAGGHTGPPLRYRVVIHAQRGRALSRHAETVALINGFAVDFHLDIVIEVVAGVAAAVEADVASLGAFGVD